MRWWSTALASGVRRHWRLLGGVALAAGLGVALAGGGSAASGASTAAAFDGYAFDACNAPKLDTLNSWLASPYRALGIYVGGANRACSNTQLSAAWTSTAVATGWNLIPLYVGLQAPCVGRSDLAKISPALASSQGTAAADDATSDATTLGLPPGSPIYFDMEGYSVNNPACSQAVQAFVTGWVNELHALGNLAGVYGSASSTIRDLQALATTGSSPDDVWIANWNGNESVFGDPYVSDTLWPNHQRIHQYRGAHDETWNGATINIDSSYVDAAVVGSTGSTPLPGPPTTTPLLGESAAGSVTAPDGLSTVNWPAGAFRQSVVVSLTPTLPATPVPGFASGGYGVQLQVEQTATAQIRTGFAAGLTIHMPARPGPVAPMASTDGATWRPLPPLFSGTLPKGVRAGYSRNADGSLDIQTTSGGFFAVLPERSRPPAPSGLTGHFSHGELVLSWQKSTGPSGDAVSYQVTLTNHPLLAIPGQTTAAVSRIHHAAPSVYRVVATDAAGKVSEPSKPLVLLPTKRPKNIPKALPRWAFDLFNWLQNGKDGTRPAAPKIVPQWFWRWYDWAAAPFHIRS
jgi:Domain of unknown function (DUF1906)